MENNISVNLENLSEEEREQLMKIIKKSNGSKRNIWKPEYDEWYFYVSGYGIVGSNVWINAYIDNGYYEIGNCFKTEEEADFALEKLKVEAELRRFAEENNEYEIDWKDDDQEKWFMYYNCDMKKIDIIYNTVLKTHCIYFSSKKIAKQAIDYIGEERLKKYYLGIED